MPAVLFRSSFLSFDLEIELAKAGIPFLKFGGYKFIETAHVKDMIAYLRVIDNPRDVVAWNRILLLIDGVGFEGGADVCLLAVVCGLSPVSPFKGMEWEAGWGVFVLGLV